MLLQKRNFIVFVFLFTLSGIAYWQLAYRIQRGDALLLLGTLMGLSLAFFYMMRYSLSLKVLFGLGLFFRLIFLFSVPELSQDFYRFLWDGNIQLLGLNPFTTAPDGLLGTIDFPLLESLYTHMGSLSASHTSSYPPLSQWLFKGVMYFNQNSILDATLLLRLCLMVFELMVFAFGVTLLKSFNVPPQRIGWYFLNPLVIIETIGNLHGEGMMLALCLAGFYFSSKKYLFWGGLFISLSIATKLIPLLLLPVFFYFLGWKRFLLFGIAILIFSLLLWWPFIDLENIENYWTTVYLWFNTFEFNASSYYIVREIGYELKGYNIIRRLGKVTPFIVIGVILIFSLLGRNRNLSSALKSMLFLLSIYFFMATTVHPWYVISLVVLGLLSGYVYPMVWSGMVFLSYSAYANDGFEEHGLLLLLEYLPVYACLFYEVFRGPLLHHFQKTNLPLIKVSPISSG